MRLIQKLRLIEEARESVAVAAAVPSCLHARVHRQEALPEVVICSASTQLQWSKQDADTFCACSNHVIGGGLNADLYEELKQIIGQDP